MRKFFTYIFLFFSFLTAEKGPFEKGVNFYNSRSEGAVGYNVRLINIENAIKQFKKVKNKFHIRMILRQGKKNEIRRIFKFSNIKLLSLKRVKFGDIALGDLKEGFWRELTKKEKEYLKKVRLK